MIPVTKNELVSHKHCLQCLQCFTVNVMKFQTLLSFFFSNKMLVFRCCTHKMLVRIANREDLQIQKQSELGLRYFV